jgi:DNA-binding transcriptional LysR family regulator
MDARVLAGVTVLATVVERGSFTRAAELLGLSASGVSRAIFTPRTAAGSAPA